jgi:glycosyltransferase A (GT-A) superfamily protein (DUF2064 family)
VAARGEVEAVSTLFALLAEDPQPGRVKPGLAEALGAPAAAKVSRSFLMDLCERFAGLSVRSRVLAYRPRGARQAVGLLASRHWRLTQQQGTSRGQVLANLFEQAFRTGHSRVVVQVSDCPTVPGAAVVEAFDRLLIDDLVLGPTTDGDVYLVGLSLERPELFVGVDFGAGGVFDALVDRAEAFGLVLGLVAPWYEVNGRAGLDLLAGHVRALALAGSDQVPRRTQTLLQRLGHAD